MAELTRNDLKQAILSLEALSLHRSYSAKERCAMYDHSVTLRALLDTETKKPLETISKKYKMVREEVEDSTKSMNNLKNRDRFIEFSYLNHPEKKKLDKQVVDIWEGPVICKVRSISLPELKRFEGSVEVNSEGTWNVDTAGAWDHLVAETGIVKIEKPIKKHGTDND